MQVAQYTYQSPSPSAVQFGRLDPSSVKSESNASSSEQPQSTDQTVTKAQEFQATQTQEVAPVVSENRLDVYA